MYTGVKWKEYLLKFNKFPELKVYNNTNKKTENTVDFINSIINMEEYKEYGFHKKTNGYKLICLTPDKAFASLLKTEPSKIILTSATMIAR